MSLLSDLKVKREDAIELIAGVDIDIAAIKQTLEREQETRSFWVTYIAEIDTAIAALEPVPVEDPGLREVQAYTSGRLDGYTQAIQSLELAAEKEVAREQLEREDDASEIISDLTGDPAIEPESGLHGEPVDGFTLMHNAVVTQTYTDLGSNLVRGTAPEAPALNSDMQDEREEGYAPVTNPTIDDLIPEAMRQELEAEQRYSQPTNPEADALAKAHDWYDPKAVADRQKFNPWGGVSNLFGKPKVDA